MARGSVSDEGIRSGSAVVGDNVRGRTAAGLLTDAFVGGGSGMAAAAMRGSWLLVRGCCIFGCAAAELGVIPRVGSGGFVASAAVGCAALVAACRKGVGDKATSGSSLDVALATGGATRVTASVCGSDSGRSSSSSPSRDGGQTDVGLIALAVRLSAPVTSGDSAGADACRASSDEGSGERGRGLAVEANRGDLNLAFVLALVLLGVDE